MYTFSPKPGGTLPSAGKLRASEKRSIASGSSGTDGKDRSNRSSHRTSSGRSAKRRQQQQQQQQQQTLNANDSTDSSDYELTMRQQRKSGTLPRRRGSRDFLRNEAKSSSGNKEEKGGSLRSTVRSEKTASSGKNESRNNGPKLPDKKGTKQQQHHDSVSSMIKPLSKSPSPRRMNESFAKGDPATKTYYSPPSRSNGRSRSPPLMMSTSGDDMLSDKEDSRKSLSKKSAAGCSRGRGSGSKAPPSSSFNVVASPSTIIKSFDSPRGSLGAPAAGAATGAGGGPLSHLMQQKKDCPLSDPNYYMYSRQRSNREELDFTSNRQQSEINKKKMMEEFHMEQPLIQDKIIQELTATFKHASRNKKLTSKIREISKSYGDGLDERGGGSGSSAKSRKAKSRASGSKSKESLRDISCSRDELDKIEDDYYADDDDAKSGAASAKGSTGQASEKLFSIGAPSGFSDSSKGGGEGLSSTYSQERESSRHHHHSNNNSSSSNKRPDSVKEKNNSSLIGSTMIEPPDLFNTNKKRSTAGDSSMSSSALKTNNNAR